MVGATKPIPDSTQNVQTVGESEGYRKRITEAIVKRVTDIQNAGLAEERIRELNEEINNLLKKKKEWELRIR